MEIKEQRNANPTCVWLIGGSDSSGGAGLQADIAVLQDLSIPSCSIVTAITAQSHTHFFSLKAISTDLLNEQWQAAWDSSPPTVIKIGALVNDHQIKWLASKLSALRESNINSPCVIYDPVMMTSSRSVLITHEAVTTIESYLLPNVDVVTPNAHEYKQLNWDQYHSWLVQKGGHEASEPAYSQQIANDLIYINKELIASLSAPKIDVDCRGTGCTFATSLAAFYCHQLIENRSLTSALKEAFVLAKAYVYQGLKKAYGDKPVNKESKIPKKLPKLGWPLRPQSFPKLYAPPIVQENEQGAFPPVNWSNAPIFYPVVDRLDLLESCLKAEVPVVQLRIKTLDEQKRRSLIQMGCKLAQHSNSKLFINDDWQAAIEFGAYGVHLGQEDLIKANLNAILVSKIRLGISTHGYWELLKALAYKPSYVAIGSVFHTTTKDMSGQIQGLQQLKRLQRLCGATPSIAIGGINTSNAADVLNTGVQGVAVVRAVTEADDTPKTLTAWLDQFRSFQSSAEPSLKIKNHSLAGSLS